MKRAERLHALTELLRRQGAGSLSAERLASEFDVSVRTIKRDLAALDSAGLPIWARPGPGGGYGLATQATLPPINLTANQALALLTAVSAAAAAPYADAARAGVHKILDVLDPRTRSTAAQLAERIWVDGPARPRRATMSALEVAMTQQQVVRIRYTDRHGTTTNRDVEPVLFAATLGQWYVVGWCRLRGAMLWFSVARIERATVTQEPCSGHQVAEVGTPPPSARSVSP